MPNTLHSWQVTFGMTVYLIVRQDGALEELLNHENQAWPPALSDRAALHIGANSHKAGRCQDI